jgi:FKBP-type peptidyl-prolyl cis-trans isomerase (trigger factor)
MAVEVTEKSQIGWRDLGETLHCDIPGVTASCAISMTEVHESWKDFLLRYGIAQWIGSDLAKLSVPISEDLKEDYQRAKRESLRTDLTSEELKLALAEFEDVKTLVRAEKVKNAKARASDVQKVVFDMMKMLKVQRIAKAKAEKETKAQVEARVKAELITKMRIGFEAMGLSEEQIAMMVANL